MPGPRAPLETETWTTRRLQQWIGPHLESCGVDSARTVADLLLAHVFDCDRMRLYMEVDRPATPAEREELRGLVVRAARHEPVQYIVGQWWFFSRPFEVGPVTLIPRPSTETLVEHLVQDLRREPLPDEPVIVDVGTGTGCIAISLALAFETARVIATDVSAPILELATRNAERHGVADRLTLLEGPGLEPVIAHLGDDRADVLCSNPPYVPDDEMAELAPNVRDWEPASALAGGVDGMDVVGPLIDGAQTVLAPGGRIAIEIAHRSREDAMERAERAGFEGVDVVKDHEGLWRVLVGRT